MVLGLGSALPHDVQVVYEDQVREVRPSQRMCHSISRIRESHQICLVENKQTHPDSVKE